MSLIKSSRKRVWLKVPWWDHASPHGHDLGGAVVDAVARGVDVRVIMRNDGSSLPTVNALRQRAVPARCFRYLHEKELIADDAYLTHSMNFTRAETERNTQLGNRMDEGVGAAADSFLQTWNQLESLEGQRGQVRAVAASSVVPGDWLQLLEHQSLNPFQSDIAPAVLAQPFR